MKNAFCHGQALPAQSISADGYLVRQPLLGEIPYGHSSTDRTGCGWIAAYNILHRHGANVSWETVHQAFNQRHWFGGHMGTSPVRLTRYLRKQGLRVRWSVTPKAAAVRAFAATAGAVLYLTGMGAHYVAFYPVPAEGSLRFLNSAAPCGEEISTLAQFCKQAAKLGIFLCITVETPRLP